MSATPKPLPAATSPAAPVTHGRIPRPRAGRERSAPPARPAPARPGSPPPGGTRRPAHRRADRRLPVTVLAVTAVVAAWLLVVLVAPRVQVPAGLHEVARFGHLAALVLGFGAALTVEWFGLLWLLRRRPLSMVLQVAQGAHAPIWLGLAGLAVTGAVLVPAQLAPLSLVKLSAVLLVALNGIYAWRLQRRLATAGPVLPRSLMLRMSIAATVSQLGWWSAVTIGFISAHV